ncbi:MAG: MFS transporter [Treponema sp.]|nr:MFS transporter [Treponema sp.]
MEKDKRIFLLIISLALTVASGFLFSHYNKGFDFQLSKSIEYDSPYLVREQNGIRYVLDKQRTRILAIDKSSNTVRYILPSSKNDPDFFTYADDFMVDERGRVYVKEGAWSGNRISREAILIYDENGKYLETCLDVNYTTVVNKHKIMLLSVSDGKINYGIKSEDNVTVGKYDLESKNEEIKGFPFNDAFNFTADMTMDRSGKVYMLDKSGRLYSLEEKPDCHFELLYTAQDDEYPAWIEVSDEGKLLFADLYSDCIKEVDLKSGEKSVKIEKAGSMTVTPISFSDLKAPDKNNRLIRKDYSSFLIFVLFCLSAFVLVINIFMSFIKSKMHIIQRISVYIIIIVFAVAGTITIKLTREFSTVMRSQLLTQMENMAYSVANNIKPGTLDSIDSAADFASPEYREMIECMENLIDTELNKNNNIYCDVFKYDEKHGAYACAYLDQAIGCYSPLTEGEVKEIRQIYDYGQPISSSKDDTSASYTYVSVPVINDSGEVRGVVSVMTENFMLNAKISEMQKNVLLGIVITMIFVWLIMGEALSYILSKTQAQMDIEKKIAAGETITRGFPHYYIRLIVFALFAAYNMTTTFLPMVIAKGLFVSHGLDAGSLAAALPISVNLFIIGLMALFCEDIITKLGFKKIIITGSLLSALSNLIIFLFPTTYFLLFLSLIIDGIGVGLTTNSMYMMVSKVPDKNKRTSGYAAYNAAQISGINFGMLGGAALAANIGRFAIFPLVSLMWIITGLLFIMLWKSLNFQNTEVPEKTKKDENRLRKLISFLCQRRIWSYILLAQGPFALMGSFVYYYLPLYSDINGLSEVTVAILMMLYSMFAIYMGNNLTKFVINKTGIFSPYIAIVLSGIALLTYALMASFLGLIIAIFILGLANGFGRSVLQSNFSLLEECENYGLAQAMGIFNFTDFIGQSFGPALMGLVFLSKNISLAAGIFVIFLLILSIIHFIINLKHGKKN